MATSLTLDETFILSIWLEVMLYGLYLGLVSTSVYIIVRKQKYRTVPSKVMFGTMLLMFLLATIHLSMNLYRMLSGYVWLRDAPGGPAAYFADLTKWDHIVKDTIYVTQSIIGDALSIYRCFIVWGNNYYIIAFPVVLILASTCSGYFVSWLFTTVPDASIFSPRLNTWILSFYSIALAQNIITTGLIAYHIWRKDRAATILAGRSSLMPIVRVVIESAAIYVVAEFILLVLYAINNPAQYIVLETITPIVGIVFTSITVRLALRIPNTQTTSLTTIGGTHRDGRTGSNLPMQPLTVHVNHSVTKNIDWDSSPSERDVSSV